MGMSFTVSGMDELLRGMDKIPEKAAKVAAEALYEGAGVVADEVGRAVQGIATKPFVKAKGGFKRMASPEEKAILMQARKGIAKFRNNGTEVNTSVGFQNSGYADLDGERVPIPLIANAINSGTSFRQKQPFMRKAFAQSKNKATAAIENGIRSREDELKIDD